MTSVRIGTVGVDPIDDLNGVVSKLGNFWTLVHMSDAVFFSRENPVPKIERFMDRRYPSIKEMRIFSEKGELHLWQWNNELRWRSRFDGDEAKSNDYYEEEHFLWGNKCRKTGDHGFMLYEEGRGCKFGFPYELDYENLPLKMEVRNYIDYCEDGLLRISDARLVALSDKKGMSL